MEETDPTVATFSSTIKKKSFLGKGLNKLKRVRSTRSKPQQQSGHGQDKIEESRNTSSSSSFNNDDEYEKQMIAAKTAQETQAALATKSVARDGTIVLSGVNTNQFQPSDVRDEDLVAPTSTMSLQSTDETQTLSPSSTKSGPSPSSAKSSRRGKRQMVVLEKAPTAKESAFGGPPKYDWIDIETAAAVKVQSVFRRNKVMAELEKQGLTTAAVRNRHRSRARASRGGGALGYHSEDAPGLLACCGVGFLFGDATGEGQEVLAEERRKEYQLKKLQQEEEERRKRKYRYRKKASDHLDEEYEVVDS